MRIHNLTLLCMLICSISIWGQLDPGAILILVQGTTAEINAINNPPLGAMVYNTDQNKVFQFTGSGWGSLPQTEKSFTSTDGSVSFTENNASIDFSIPSSGPRKWAMDGNSNADSNSFLGTTNDILFEIRSNNWGILQFGRRETLDLSQNFPDYQNEDQPMVYLNGDGDTAALQFQASGAAFYKPMFFTTTNGNFRLKGSSGVTDLFEIGSKGPSNDGSLEFIIGDDGTEPIIFKRYDYRNGGFHKELFRVQGHNNSSSAKTRFGININTSIQALDPDYDDGQTGLNIANSTLQVGGSLSMAIHTTSTNITLTEDHYTVIVTSNLDITLPAASSCKGRIYVLKNTHSSNVDISPNFIDSEGVSRGRIVRESVTQLQSDGNNWHQIN